MALIFAMIKILPMIDQKYIDIILDRVDIEDVVSCYVGGDLKRQGHRLWACCPFHNENTPSFCVDTIKNTWHCFGSCGEGGNVISFVMKAESLPFPIAVKKILKDYLHIEIKESDFVSTHEDELTQKKKESMFIINDQLCKYFFTRIHEEIENIVKTKKIYHSQLTFNSPLQPIFITVNKEDVFISPKDDKEK